MRLLAFDLENSPMLSYHWGRWKQNIRPDQTVEESRVLCFGAMWLDTKRYTFKAAYEHGRGEMLETIREMLTKADGVVSWNGASFDTKKINTEFLLEGMDPPAPYVEVDLMRAAKRRFSFSSNSLNHVAQQLGVGEKVIHEGFSMWPKVMQGDEKARRMFKKYQKQDVILLDVLYEKLKPWLPTHPNAALFVGDEMACVRCGSTRLQRRGQMRTGAATYPRYQCQSCGKWQRGKSNVGTTETRSI